MWRVIVWSASSEVTSVKFQISITKQTFGFVGLQCIKQNTPKELEYNKLKEHREVTTKHFQNGL